MVKMKTTVEIPKKLIPVFSGEADVRGAWGGRGSGKTRTFATMACIRAYMWASAGREGIILCARQFMNSLEDSSMEEIKHAIRALPWLLPFFDIGERYIRTKCGRVYFKFAGLDRSIDSIKSTARILLCWIDEAEPVTEMALNVLIPTLREEDSELWVTWNPKVKGSAVDRRFRNSRDPRFKVIGINWQDNPKFPAKLNRDRLRDLAERPDAYEHIWEGGYGNIEGAILARLVGMADRENRITDEVVYDKAGSGIEVTCDLGFRDTASFWYWQRVPGGFNLLKYDGDSGLDADDWIPRIQANIIELGARGVGKIWLPHDAMAKTFQSKHTTMEKFLTGFGAGKVAMIPMTRKSDQISAARAVILKCAFNRTLCERGLDGLRAWEFTFNQDTGVFSKDPLHNWASHPSDAFAYGCQVMQDFKAPVAADEAIYPMKGQAGKIVTAPLEDMWKESGPSTSRRI